MIWYPFIRLSYICNILWILKRVGPVPNSGSYSAGSGYISKIWRELQNKELWHACFVCLDGELNYINLIWFFIVCYCAATLYKHIVCHIKKPYIIMSPLFGKRSYNFIVERIVLILRVNWKSNNVIRHHWGLLFCFKTIVE